MSECDKLLKHGVFDTIIINFNKSVSENLIEWLKTVDFNTFNDRVSGGLNIGFPIILEGVPMPVDIGMDFSEDEFNQWKRAVQEGKYRNFTENETLQIIKRTASEIIVNGWLECIRTTNNNSGTGIICNILSEDNAATILFKAQFIPNSAADADSIPKVQEFIVTGASSIQGISVGDEIPFSGVIATIIRDSNKEVTINLLTEKGACSKIVPSIPEPAPEPTKWEVSLPFCNPIEKSAFPINIEISSGPGGTSVKGDSWSVLSFSNGIKLYNVGATGSNDNPLKTHLNCPVDMATSSPNLAMRYNIRIYQKDKPDEAATVILMELPGIANGSKSTNVRVQVALSMYNGIAISPMPEGLINLFLYYNEPNTNRLIKIAEYTGTIDKYTEMELWSIESIVPPNTGIKAELISKYKGNLWGANRSPGFIRIHDARLSGISIE